MATIRASCGDCGDVELTSAEVTVRVCSADRAGSYMFRCPSCAVVVVKEAEARIVELLVTSGVRLVTWHLPAELSERHEGDPIDHDDLLDFHALMESDTWIDALRKMTPH
ncbi:MAG: hypothetical protein ACR2MB_15330 [Acidimicrobiales bacterium]